MDLDEIPIVITELGQVSEHRRDASDPHLFHSLCPGWNKQLEPKQLSCPLFWAPVYSQLFGKRTLLPFYHEGCNPKVTEKVVYMGPQQTVSVTHFLFPVFLNTEYWVNLCLYDALRLSCYLTRQLAPKQCSFSLQMDSGKTLALTLTVIDI